MGWLDPCSNLGDWEKLMTMGAWRSSGNTNNMWDKTTSCSREAKIAKEVLGV